MNKNETKMHENAKVDWMRIVDKHKKKQKGLPALSRMNTNAGNVEHNIKMFNHMSSGIEAPTTNPISGPFEGGASLSVSAGMAEAFNNNSRSDEMIDLEFKNLPVEVEVENGSSQGYYDPTYGAWFPDDNEMKEVQVDWIYSVPKQDIIEFLQDNPNVQADLAADTLSDEVYEKLVDAQFDSLLVTYKDIILDHYYDKAIEDARKNYVLPETSFNSDTNSDNYFDQLDDKFDLSMRTLL